MAIPVTLLDDLIRIGSKADDAADLLAKNSDEAMKLLRSLAKGGDELAELARKSPEEIGYVLNALKQTGGAADDIVEAAARLLPEGAEAQGKMLATAFGRSGSKQAIEALEQAEKIPTKGKAMKALADSFFGESASPKKNEFLIDLIDQGLAKKTGAKDLKDAAKMINDMDMGMDRNFISQVAGKIRPHESEAAEGLLKFFPRALGSGVGDAATSVSIRAQHIIGYIPGVKSGSAVTVGLVAGGSAIALSGTAATAYMMMPSMEDIEKAMGEMTPDFLKNDPDAVWKWDNSAEQTKLGLQRRTGEALPDSMAIMLGTPGEKAGSGAKEVTFLAEHSDGTKELVTVNLGAEDPFAGNNAKYKEEGWNIHVWNAKEWEKDGQDYKKPEFLDEGVNLDDLLTADGKNWDVNKLSRYTERSQSMSVSEYVESLKSQHDSASRSAAEERGAEIGREVRDQLINPVAGVLANSDGQYETGDANMVRGMMGGGALAGLVGALMTAKSFFIRQGSSWGSAILGVGAMAGGGLLAVLGVRKAIDMADENGDGKKETATLEAKGDRDYYAERGKTMSKTLEEAGDAIDPSLVAISDDNAAPRPVNSAKQKSEEAHIS